MARLEEKTCPRCRQNFTGTEMEKLCGRCQEIIAAEKKKSWLQEFRGNLTIEERVAKIEERLYWLQKHEHHNILDQRF